MFQFGIETLKNPDQIVNGAVYIIQLLLLTKEMQNDALVEIFPQLLKLNAELIEHHSSDNLICRILHEIYLAAFINNCQYTLMFLQEFDQNGIIF